MEARMERAGDKVTYRCRLCRHQLFDSTCVLNPAPNHHPLVVGQLGLDPPSNLTPHKPSSTSYFAAYPPKSSTPGTPPPTSTSPFFSSSSSSSSSSSISSSSSSSSSASSSSPFSPQSSSSPSSSPSLSSSSSLPWSLPPEAWPGISRTVSFPLLERSAALSGTSSSGVLAPFGQVCAGPNPLWFIDEESTPPWVQNTLDKFQWKKGKLSCPKCYGRVGSFDFVTPSKLNFGRHRGSRIHIMRSRVDCESFSPVIARIRPMPQNKLLESKYPISSEGQGTSQGVPMERLLTGAESPLEDIPGTTAFMPEPFSSASDEESASVNPNVEAFQSQTFKSRPVRHKQINSTCPVRDSIHTDQSQTHSANRRPDSHVGTSSSANTRPAQRSDQHQVRHRVTGSRIPGDMSLYFPDTHRSNYPVQLSSSANLIHRSRDTDLQGQQHAWHYDRLLDAAEEEEAERGRFYSNHPTSSSTPASDASSQSRPNEISANIFKNSHAFLRPFIRRGFSSEQSRVPGPSTSQPSELYSQVHSADQMDRTSPSSRDSRTTTCTVSGAIRESDDEEELGHGDDFVSQNENNLPCRPQRSPREQRKERNRKKKERRKQRRYERWLERQTLGAEEESAIQDISAAGLYSLLGPRCAGSSLREVTTCSVCLDIYYQPHTCYPCEHIFCEPCLRQVARFHPVVTPCPLCRTTIRTVKLHEQLTSAVKQLFPRQFENRHQMERRTLNRSFPLPGNANLLPWYRMGYHQNNRNQVDFLASRRNPGYVHDWGMRYLQGVVWRVVASTVVLLVVSGISVGFLHFMFDFS